MGVWCSRDVADPIYEVTGAERNGQSLQNKGVNSRLDLCKEKNIFSLAGIAYSLTKGLLMGVPFFRDKILLKNVPLNYLQVTT